MDFNPSKHVWDILKRAQPLQPNLRQLNACYQSDVPFYNSFFTDTLYHGEWCTLL